jgi:hypothetical protein
MATTTPQQGLPVPEATDDPNVAEDITNLALAIEKRLVGVYTSAADRDAKVTAPQEGQVAITKDNDRMFFYSGSAWVQMFPAVVPSITSGTTAPSNATGSNGDVYFRV